MLVMLLVYDNLYYMVVLFSGKGQFVSEEIFIKGEPLSASSAIDEVGLLCL